MTQLSSGLKAFLFIGCLIGLSSSSAWADIILEQYEFQGALGTQTTQPTSFTAAGLSGLSFTRSANLTASAAANSFASTGWNNAGAAYSFGFMVGAGQVVTVDQIVLSTRSSGTGPGFLNVQASVDGGSLVTVGSITDGNAIYNDEFLSITPITATKSITFFIVAANTTSAAGGTTAGTGTFRVGDYNPAGTPTPFTLNGTITSAATVPEPSALVLTMVGLVTAGSATLALRQLLSNRVELA